MVKSKKCHSRPAGERLIANSVDIDPNLMIMMMQLQIGYFIFSHFVDTVLFRITFTFGDIKYVLGFQDLHEYGEFYLTVIEQRLTVTNEFVLIMTQNSKISKYL
jgi:hypothetical protein